MAANYAATIGGIFTAEVFRILPKFDLTGENMAEGSGWARLNTQRLTPGTASRKAANGMRKGAGKRKM
jgi:hypothetical protein